MAVRAAEALGRRARPQDPRDEELLALSQGDRGQAAQRARQAGSVADPGSMFLGLLDPDPDPLVRGMDPVLFIIKQK